MIQTTTPLDSPSEKLRPKKSRSEKLRSSAVEDVDALLASGLGDKAAHPKVPEQVSKRLHQALERGQQFFTNLSSPAECRLRVSKMSDTEFWQKACMLHESIDCTGSPGPPIAFIEAMLEEFTKRPTQEEVERDADAWASPSSSIGKRRSECEDPEARKTQRGEYKRVSFETGAGKGQRVTKEVWVPHDE